MKKFLALMLLAAMPLLPVSIEAKSHDSSSSSSQPCCDDRPDPQFGYFYLTEEQCVEECFDTVSWEDAGSVNTDGVFIDSANPDRIVLKRKGYYLATFTVTGEVFRKVAADGSNAAATPAVLGGICCEKFQFALYLNEGDQPIPGSTYAGNSQFVYDATAGVPGACSTEVVGQVIFRVNDRNSFIQLVNQSENAFLLDNEAGTNYPPKFGFNVSASISIQRLSNIHIE